MTYTCKFHIYRENKLFARKSCEECTPDVINNPNCPDYAPVELKDFLQLKGRNFNVVKRLDDLK
jgi:hypothetical protein